MSRWAYIGEIFLVMVILCVLVIGAIALIKLLNKKMSVTSNNTMEVVDSLSIGPNKGLYLVRVVSKYYLIGIGDSVNLLKEINDPDEVDLIEEISSPLQSSSVGDSFADNLIQQLNKFKSDSKGE
ncbi:flagellar biosynthetic protein FliO [Proteinivorax hydrogeniformans]|uniref:Flagellar biosynthetic protein FliO n=1 Tax=Proteinivorax hydrogeniformans TaxID=1826727 RepID=A0AAU8HQK1_9FIRM